MLMQSEVAGVGRRLVALVVDLMMLTLASIPLQMGLREVTFSPVVLVILLYLVMLCYSTIFLSGRGQTPGKIMASLRVISLDGSMVDQRQAFVRSVVKWTPIFGFWIIFIWMGSVFGNPEAMVQRSVGEKVVLEQEFFSSGVLLMGVIVGLFLIVKTRRHPEGQAFHDWTGGTCVIRVG